MMPRPSIMAALSAAFALLFVRFGAACAAHGDAWRAMAAGFGVGMAALAAAVYAGEAADEEARKARRCSKARR